MIKPVNPHTNPNYESCTQRSIPHVNPNTHFVLCGDKLPKEIKIESSPFVIPLTLNVDYFLDIEIENTILKAKLAELSK